MNPRVLYLIDESLEHPVLQSQSLAVLARLMETGVRADLLIANGAGAAQEESLARSVLGEGPRVVQLSRRQRGSSSLAKARRALARALAYGRASRLVASLDLSAGAVVLHARGSAHYLGSRLKRNFGSIRLVSDVRGDAAAEARFHIGGAAGDLRAESIERMEARAFANADHVLCVSGTLLAEIRRRFAIRCPATVIPCVADERRFSPDTSKRIEGRRSLGLGSEPVIVYSGSIGQWHQFDAILRTFERIAGQDAAARFLIATRDLEDAERRVSARANLKGRALVRHGGTEDVARWLNAADVGLLLREPHPLNRVACPTKFAEYALSGLSVVVSAEIGDLEPWVRELDLGACVRGADVNEAAEACLRIIARGNTEEHRVGRARRSAPTLGMGSRLHDWVDAYREAMKRTTA